MLFISKELIIKSLIIIFIYQDMLQKNKLKFCTDIRKSKQMLMREDRNGFITKTHYNAINEAQRVFYAHLNIECANYIKLIVIMNIIIQIIWLMQ